MKKAELEPLALEAAKSIKTENDLNEFGKILTKITVEAALKRIWSAKASNPLSPSLDDKILSLYAKGMTTREIIAAFKELYDAEVLAALVSKVTDALIVHVIKWQYRPLDGIYLIVYLDCILVNIR
jgi:transposase-like protein